ncbi:MAG: hypothetical protein ACSLEM_06445 [Candidatus Malihini olakiniferum]
MAYGGPLLNFCANGGLFETLLDEEDTIISYPMHQNTLLSLIGLGKALSGAFGGYVAACKLVIDWLRQSSRL